MFRIEVDLRGPDGLDSPNNVQADNVPWHRVAFEVQKVMQGTAAERFSDVQLLEIRVIPVG